MPAYDMNYAPIDVGDRVQMSESLRNHDIVKGVPYEIVGITPVNSLLTLLNPATGYRFNDRRADAFYKIDPEGPW